MTRDEAIKNITMWMYATSDLPPKQVAEALDLAITALRRQIWEEQVWHDAKKDPPKTPGLYYGKKDDTNSMYACRYRDSVWVLDMYPQQQMDIVQWADYAAFVRQDEDTALRPVSREQVEKVWRGEWIHDPEPNEALTLEQLREMDGEPVWVVPIGKCKWATRQWCVLAADEALIPGVDHWWWSFEGYGETWIAYRRPKEEQ